MENSSNALIAWGSDINKQEMSYGMTPLHLAVMSGNGHIVKKLLHKGCDKQIKATNGKLALEMARENEYKNIVEMILGKQTFSELIGLKTPFQKLKKHTFPFYMLIFFFCTGYLLNIIVCLYLNF
jgi:ankyrin repeat protein